MIWRAIRLHLETPGIKHGTGHQQMTFRPWMHAVFGKGELSIRLPLFSNGGVHRAVNVQHLPAFLAHVEQPARIEVEHLIVALVKLARLHLVASNHALLDRHRIKHGRCEMHNARSCGGDFFMQLLHAILERFGPHRAERQVNAVIHAVAGKDKLRLGLFQRSVKTLVQIRTRKLATGMAVFAQTAHRFAAEAERNDLLGHLGMLRDQCGINELNVTTSLRDAVAQKDDALFFGKFRSQCCDGKEEGEDEITHERMMLDADDFAQRHAAVCDNARALQRVHEFVIWMNAQQVENRRG